MLTVVVALPLRAAAEAAVSSMVSKNFIVNVEGQHCIDGLLLWKFSEKGCSCRLKYLLVIFSSIFKGLSICSHCDPMRSQWCVWWHLWSVPPY